MSDDQRLLSGRYEVGELIGRGGMAEVHTGYDTRLGREVAVKILRSDLARDRSFLMRFRREAQSAASLNHPSIVAVFDSGEEKATESGGAPVSVPFIVMEYVHGRTLRDILTDDGPLDPFEACRVVAHVLRALDYSHEHGIIHRDIKPANVMIGRDGEAKVMDFGIARAIADTAATMTNTSVVVGTAQYLSPEQAQGHDIDARSDLYSAGCLLYELLTGRPPFVGDSPVAIAYQHVGEPPQPPSVHTPGVPSALDVVVLHSLAKDPAARYQSGAEFAADLDAILTGGGTLAARKAVAAGHLSPPREPETGGQRALGATAVTTTEEAPPPGPRRRLLWPVLLGLLALAGIILGVLYANGFFRNEPEAVTVPNVVSKTEAEAKQLLTQAGLQPASQPVKNRARAGTVVAQEPAAQTSLPPESIVRLSVSTGPTTSVVPDLRNYDQRTASEALARAGLTMGGIDLVDSYTVGQGNVVSTDPKAGSKVAEGTTVKLKISTGKTTVPSVIGMSLRKASETLADVGLRPLPVQEDSTKSPGTVIAQNYPKGSKVAVGETVQITIARPAPTTPPPTTVTVTSPPTTPTPTPTPPEPTTDPGTQSPPPETTDDPNG